MNRPAPAQYSNSRNNESQGSIDYVPPYPTDPPPPAYCDRTRERLDSGECGGLEWC